MDDADRAEIELLVVCGIRRKPWYNFCRTTTRQEFITHMDTWLGNEFPQNYTALFYNKMLRKMIQLDENEICYLAPIFDLISFESPIVGVQQISADDNHCVILFISDNNPSIASHLSSEVFPRDLPPYMNELVAETLNPTTTTDSVSLDISPCPTHYDLLESDLFDKDLFDLNHDIQEDIEPLTTIQHISPITNIQFRLVDHIRMVLDVCPTPRRVNYTSNMGRQGKSNLQYLSGIRGPNDRGKHIRPIIRIPDMVLQWLRMNNSLDLVIACVQETLEDGTLTWWIDKNSKFRTKGCQRNVPGRNPFDIALTSKKIKNGTYKLEVILTRVPGQINQIRKGELLYALDERTVKELHPAEHDSESPRLVFFISCFGVRQLNTIGCSNFIQDPNRKEKAASANNGTNLEIPAAQS